jgi:radical SAM superfamily enzyme YgiQ (UPF0313 family)
MGRQPEAPMPNVLMVFPRFNQNSFWNLQAVCDTYGSRAQSPPLGLMTVAALLPPEWNVRLVDRNADTLQESDLAWAHMVMTGGMLPQRADTFTIIDLAHDHGKPVVVGGPDPMSSPEEYEDADFRVLGEAEGLIEAFIEAWNAGALSGTYEGERFKADVTKSPVPRFDLVSFSHYSYMGVQFSRGCPFTCEFCDIIELYGRVPRSKTNEQMLGELEALYAAGYRGHINFVDDNLIGNKKALKRFLPALAAWQRQRGYPFELSTEASINLADDRELLDMMSAANFFGVFVGIESPDTETLVAMQKKQNTRRSLVDSVHKLYDAGIVVIAGFIVGFDSEQDSVAPQMIECIEATNVPVCMVGLLTALPNTQLTRRLEGEKRLLPLAFDHGDQCTTSTSSRAARAATSSTITARFLQPCTTPTPTSGVYARCAARCDPRAIPSSSSRGSSRTTCDSSIACYGAPPSPSRTSPAISGGRSPPSRGPTRRHSST